MFRVLTVYILITIFSLSGSISSVIAREDEAMHSLESLPYGDIAEEDSRKMLLEGDVSAPTISDEAITLTAHLENETMTLLAMKRTFDMSQPENSGNTLTLSPSLSLVFGTSSLISSFLSPYAPSILDTTPTPLPSETSKTIRIKKSAKQKKNIKTIRGAVSFEIASGTVITGSKGEIIDSSKIGFYSLESEKKQKAKSQYEKKMKNRGNMRKGRSEAQVEGFGFGLSGTHLLFSQPVMLTIDTPNMTDGNIVDLMTLHEGDNAFHTGGLSTSPDTRCNPDGSTTLPSAEAVVKNGKITFYTCGASSFTMNPTGGTTGSNDLRLIIGDCGQTQIYYNNLSQIYTGNPPGTGCSTGGSMDSWPALRIGGATYGNDFGAWSSATTVGTTLGNTYTATSTMTRIVGGLTYTLIINWSHTAPEKFITWDWEVIIPAGNTQNIRFYYGMDSYVAGGDANDTGILTSTGGLTIGVYDGVADVLSAFRYMSGLPWTAHQANGYNTVRTRIVSGLDFTNAVQTTGGDLGFGVNWNLGTTPGTYTGALQWRLTPFVSASVPDLIPGIGLPEGALTTGYLSQIPITLSNVGNATSTGVHTAVLTLPANINGPASAFTDNGWSCGIQVGTTVTCNKTTTIAPLANETFRIPVVPQPAAGGTSVTFNVAISNASDSDVTNNTAFATNAVVSGAPSFDPGGVTNERLWLRADTGTNCTTTGCSITTWTNQGSVGAAANAVSGVNTVTYDPANQINGNPTLYFNNAALHTNNNLGLPTRAISLFAVTKIATGGQFLIGTQTVTNRAREWSTTPTTDRWKRYNSTTFYNGTNSRAADIPAITTTIRQAAGASAGYTNSLQVLSNGSTNTFLNNNIGIGRVANTYSSLANVAEIIVYSNGITIAQKNQVESYLAIKYGITLDQTTATNYVLSNGSIAWNASLAGSYNNNITGIARDDTSALSQNQSQSVTDTGDIIVSKGIFGTNRHALLWANDGGGNTLFSTTDAPVGYQRIDREWQFQEKNGDVGTVKISYPASSLPGGAISPLYMLVDSDGIFAAGATAYTGTLVGGNWEWTINMTDMSVITFAQSGDTTAPIITSVNISSGTLIPKGTFTYTAAYTDTGSSIDTGTVGVAIFSWNTGSLTWNTTNLAGTYSTPTAITSSAGTWALSDLPSGKYRFDIIVTDTAGNTLTQSYTYFVDAIEWTIDTPVYSIGNARYGEDTFGAGEMIVTIRTVGAGINLSMLRTNDLTHITDVIPVHNGTTGWGYTQWNGTLFPPTITAHGTTQTLANVAKNIDQNGNKNTFTYRIKYAVNPDANTPAGDYSGTVSMGLGLTY